MTFFFFFNGIGLGGEVGSLVMGGAELLGQVSSRGPPGKGTGVGCHFLLQGIFPTQGLNPRLLHLLLW